MRCDADGQYGGQCSVAIIVYDNKEFPRVNLRVDFHKDPMGELRRVFNIFQPVFDYYNHSQVDPQVKPLYEAIPNKMFKTYNLS